jgi:hypothetical protein
LPPLRTGQCNKWTLYSAAGIHLVDKRIETYYKFNRKSERNSNLYEFAGGNENEQD